MKQRIHHYQLISVLYLFFLLLKNTTNYMKQPNIVVLVWMVYEVFFFMVNILLILHVDKMWMQMQCTYSTVLLSVIKCLYAIKVLNPIDLH